VSEYEFEREFTRVLGRLSALVVALVVIYYLFNVTIGLQREEFIPIVRDAVREAVARIE
jgi:hypothetical protein